MRPAEGFPAAGLGELLDAGERAEGAVMSLRRGANAHSETVITLLD